MPSNFHLFIVSFSTITINTIGIGAAQVINQNANPLQFPTKTSEVQIQGTQPLTLEQALEIARRQNLQLQTAQLQVELSRAVLREVESDMYPQLSVTTELVREQLVGQLFAQPESNSNQNEPQTRFNNQFQLVYGLYNFRRGASSRRVAEEQVRIDEIELERLTEEIRLNVTLDYYSLQEADEQVRINQSAVVNAQASLRDALALERAGVGTRFDVLQFQVDLANSQQQLTNAISSQQIARRKLTARLNIPQSITVTAADPVLIAGLWNVTLEQTIISAFQNRPELQRRLAEKIIAQRRRTVALSALKPEVSVAFNYNQEDIFNDKQNLAFGNSQSIQATLRIFDGGIAKAQAAQRTAQENIAEVQFADQRNQIRLEVETAFLQLGSNLENVQIANIALEQAREALRLGRLRFQAGVGTQTDVINAQNNLVRAEGTRSQAILNYNRALAQIQRALTKR